MSVLSVVDTLPNDLVAVGETAVRAWMRGTRKLRAYIEPMALGLAEARKRYPGDTEFGVWLKGSAYADVGKNDRLALINLGENWSDELVARIAEIPSSSARMIWEALSQSGKADDDKKNDNDNADDDDSGFYGAPRIHRSNEAWDTIDPRLVQSLVAAVPSLKKRMVWEPAAGNGTMVDQLNASGVRVHAATDVAPRRADIAEQDLFDCNDMPEGTAVIISNPPWGRLAAPFVRHALALAQKRKAVVAMLLPLPWIAGRGIADMTGCSSLELILVPRYRARWMTEDEEAALKDGPSSPKMNHIWIVWDFDRDTSRRSAIKFIDETS